MPANGWRRGRALQAGRRKSVFVLRLGLEGCILIFSSEKLKDKLKEKGIIVWGLMAILTTFLIKCTPLATFGREEIVIITAINPCYLHNHINHINHI